MTSSILSIRKPPWQSLCHRAEPRLSRGDPGFGSGGPAEFWPQGGALSTKFAQNRGFSWTIAWKLHDFEKKNLGGKGGPGPQGSASVVCQKRKLSHVIPDDQHRIGIWTVIAEFRLSRRIGLAPRDTLPPELFAVQSSKKYCNITESRN